MLKRNEALALRNLIHAADCEARQERAELIQAKCRTLEGLIRLAEIERERSLAAVAAVNIWDAREAPEGHSDPAIKLWRALRRAAGINLSRWAPCMMIAEKIFRGNRLTDTAD